MSLESVQTWLAQNPSLANIVEIVGVLLLSVIVYFVAKGVVFRLLSILIKRSKTEFDDIILDKIKPH